jgi:hypothetical protein
MGKFCASLLLLFACLPAALAQSQVNAVKVESLLDLNAILITEVDVIFVYDDSLQVPATKADWYGNREAFIAANEGRLDVVTLSIPQGFVERNLVLPPRHAEARQVWVTAYHEAGTVKLRDVSSRSGVLVQIQPWGIQIGDL